MLRGGYVSLESILEREFQRIDPSRKVTVTDLIEDAYCIRIFIKNMLISSAINSQALMLERIFGMPVNVNVDTDRDCAVITVSKVHFKKELSLHSLKNTYLSSGQKNWLIGLGEYEPVILNTQDITHMLITGPTGAGKTAFFNFLLAQTLNKIDSINHIIDPKGVDLHHYKKHPKVGSYCNDREDWLGLLCMLVHEVSIRQYFFEHSFENVPSNLEQYLAFKREFKRDDLPEFKKTFVWIDEANQVCENGSHDIGERDIIDYLTRRSRAFGIHFIFGTQKSHDLGSIKNQVNTYFLFGGHDGSSLAPNYFINIKDKHQIHIPGRMNYVRKDCGDYLHIHTPFISNTDALNLAFENTNQYEDNLNGGFYRLIIYKEFLSQYNTTKLIMQGLSFEKIKDLNFNEETKVARPTPKESQVALLRFGEKFYNLMDSGEVSCETQKNQFSDKEVEVLKSIRRIKTAEPKEKTNEANVQSQGSNTLTEDMPYTGEACELLDQLEKMLNSK